MKSALITIFLTLFLVSCTKDNTIDVKEKEIENTKDYPDINIESGLYSDIELLGNSQEEGTQLKNGDFPPDFLVNKGSDNEFSLSDLRGKVVYLEFWRTRCSYCVQAMPKMVDSYKRINNDDLIVITVSTDKFDGVSKNSVADFINDYDMNEWINLYDGSTTKNAIAFHFKIYGTPQGFLIGKDGKFVQNLHPSSSNFEDAINIELNK